ncbi:hypothetical protein [Streptomyces sp. 8N616]|uniref:hypothetical protein n=1 Tax=Streptomyces sp. 8N616 TaxID=3457414 RepID=UPI003FD489B6
MRNVMRLSAVGAGLCGALFVAAPAVAEAADGPHGNMQMCSKNVTPGILGGLLPHAGEQSESCVSSSSANPGASANAGTSGGAGASVSPGMSGGAEMPATPEAPASPVTPGQ